MIRVSAGRGLSAVILIQAAWSGGGQLGIGKYPRKGKPRQSDMCSLILFSNSGLEGQIDSQPAGQSDGQLMDPVKVLDIAGSKQTTPVLLGLTFS